VAEQIASLIQSGQLPPGSKMLTDRELVEQLGVSRATVREALIALEIQGLVETRYGSGSYVAETLPEYVIEGEALPQFFDLVEARFHVESAIAALAAKSCDAQTTQALRALIARMVDENTPFDQLEEADREFHLTIARSTGNTVLVQMVADLWKLRLRYPVETRRNNMFGPENNRSYYEREHMRIVEALEAGDPQAAERAMQVHCLQFAQQGRLFAVQPRTLTVSRLLEEYETPGD